MMIYDKNKVINYLKLHKKTIYAIFFVLIIVSLYFIFSKKSSDETTIPVSTPTTSTLINDTKDIEPPEDKAYYMNQIVSNYKPVTGYSWNENQIIYSTNEGVYEGGTNIPIINEKIDEIRWSDMFNALVKTNGTWKKLNYKTKRLEEISEILKNPYLSNDGKVIADINNNVLTVYDTEQFTSQEINFRESIEKIFFINNNNEIVVQTNFATKSYLYLIDKDLKIVKTHETDDDYSLSDVSPDGKLFILILKNKTVISDMKNNKNENIFLDNSSLNASFKNNNEYIVVEKYKDNLSRTLDNIYLINTSGNKIKISDSNQLIKKINTDINIGFNGNKEIATFVENQGKIWILALKTNIYPTYTVEGELIYSNLKPRGHQ